MNYNTQAQTETNVSNISIEIRDSEQSVGFDDIEQLSTLLADQRLRLTRFVRKHLKSEDHIDDVVQQACFEAYRNWGNFRGESRAETWLFGIAFNLMRNFRTKQYKLDLTFEALEDNHFEQPSDINEQPMHMLMRKEQIDQLSGAIDQLPIRMQAVVRCVLLEGLSYQETAEELDLPVGTVRSRLSRARDALRELMLEVQ